MIHTYTWCLHSLSLWLGHYCLQASPYIDCLGPAAGGNQKSEWPNVVQPVERARHWTAVQAYGRPKQVHAVFRV